MPKRGSSERLMWDYGDAGDRWRVKPGHIWACGPHLLACGDLEKGDGRAFLATFPAPDLVYVDPPWNTGNARSFRTKSGLDGEKGRTVDFANLLRCVVEMARGSKGSAFIEMGNQQVSMLKDVIMSSGGVVLRDSAITYYQKRPCHLIHATWTGNQPIQDTPEGMDDDDTPRWAIERCTKPGGSVFDCCVGRGLTARAADALGRHFRGLELHPRRMAVAIDCLAEAGNAPVITGMLPGYS